MKAFTVAALATVVVSGVPAYAEVVTPTNPAGWQAANVRSSGSVAITSTYKPAGQNGSLEFAMTDSSSGQDKADFVNYWGVVSGRTLGNISSVSYDWLRDSVSTTAGHYMPAFRLAYQTTDGKTGYLIYENVYNGGVIGTTVTQDQWVTASITDANYWMRAFGPSRTIEQYDVTLAEWASGVTYGSSQKLDANTNIVGIEVGVGSGWGGTFRGAVDNINLAFGRDIVSANFEPAAAVPEPATWAMMMVGFAMVGAASRYRRRRVTVTIA